MGEWVLGGWGGGVGPRELSKGALGVFLHGAFGPRMWIGWWIWGWFQYRHPRYRALCPGRARESLAPVL